MVEPNASPLVHLQRRTKILDATLAIAAKGGYEAVHMRAVAEQAGIAVVAVYRYYPSKVNMLVSALAREFEHIDTQIDSTAVEGTPHQRVHQVIRSLNRSWQRRPLLTEAMTRAFVFADISAAGEVENVAKMAHSLLARALGDGRPTEDHYHLARLIGDVWLSNLLAWSTQRASAAQVSARLDRAIRLLIGDDEHPEFLDFAIRQTAL